MNALAPIASATAPRLSVRSDEFGRLAALRRYQILDTDNDRAFDRIVRMAAELLNVPIALISLIDAERQWFKARYGLAAPETPRTLAFCDHTIRGHHVMVVPDAEKDVRFCNNPLVTGDPHIRFYAGAPLVTPDGFALGTICAIDRVPRQLSAHDAAILTMLAEQVVHEIEVRAALGELYREVDEGRRSARTLQEKGAQHEALLNATSNAIMTADSCGNLISLNRAAESLFGFEAGAAIGLNIQQFISTHECPGGNARSCSYEAVAWRKDGSEFHVDVARARWTDSQDDHAASYILRDITERIRAEAELRLRDAADQRKDKLAALGRIAGGVAHELNNLLQPVIGLAALEMEALPADGTAEQMESYENLATIVECGNQMRGVVRKILMFARKVNPELSSLDFAEVLRRTVKFVAKLLPPGIDVVAPLQGGGKGRAAINEFELVEVMTNLAVNAADAMQGRGRLAIDLDCVDLPPALAAQLAIPGGQYFKVSIADTGHGIDAAILAQIFEPFFTTKPIGKGTGLGLAMVYGVLQS